MKKSILAILLTAFTTVTSYSQETAQETVADSTAKVDRPLKFGMGFALNFVGGTNVGLSPNLTYAVSEKVSFGVGLQGNYTAIKDVQSTTTFGGNAIMQYTPTRKLVTLLEFAQLNVNAKDETGTDVVRNKFWESVLFIGAGLNITDKISLGAKYNLLYNDDESVYTSPVIPFVNITF